MATELKRLSERIARLTADRDALAARRASLAASLHADGWSLQAIADASGVKKATVQKWLR